MPDELQFDRVVTDPGSVPPTGPAAVTCWGCQNRIETEYYDVNGNVVCRRCRDAAESAAETPRGIGPLIVATLCGLGAGIVGAVIYFAVIAIAHIEIGIVAILIGYMVGYTVRKGASGRGGRRFQILAVSLTYVSVALAYTPLVIRGATDANRNAQKATTSSASGPTSARTVAGNDPVPGTVPTRARFLLGLGMLFLFVLVLPVLVVFGSLPSGLISAVIILIGMRQAWRMTGAPFLQILGPYRVGAARASTIS
jgi:hypothetical protein